MSRIFTIETHMIHQNVRNASLHISIALKCDYCMYVFIRVSLDQSVRIYPALNFQGLELLFLAIFLFLAAFGVEVR